MNEINLNAMGRSSGLDRALSSVNQHKNAPPQGAPVGNDSVQLSHVPDLSQAEAAVEDEFAALRARFEDVGDSAAYPPLETIDRLARMLAIEGPE